MMLLIDAGNTQIKLRSWQQGELGELQRLDDSGNVLRPFAKSLALVSCVATPARTAQLRAQLDQYSIQARWLKSPKYGLGIHNSYEQADKLGVDRWLALAAAYAQCQHSCCVIDVGTAITVDICNNRGQHLGGLIAPGLNPLRQALQQNTSLPSTDQNTSSISKHWLAQDTLTALQLGALHSACGLIERSIRLAREQHACDQVLLTGGDAAYLHGYLPGNIALNPDLVFQGLALYAQEHCTQANDSL